MIGAGNVTEVKSGPGFQKARNSALVAVMRRNGALAKDYAERHGVPRWYDNAQALISDPEVDAVYIATPPNVHREYTLLCAEAGKPVYVEKPMAMNFSECRDMIAACEAAHVPLWVAYYRRTLPRFLKVKELIDGGTIGDVRAVMVNYARALRPEDYDPANLPWRVVPQVSGGGIFVDIGSHTLDFLDFVIGPITAVKGMATNRAGLYPAEDQVAATFLFQSGVVGTGMWCFTSGISFDQNTIVGAKGQIIFSTIDSNPILLKTPDREENIMIEHPAHVQQPLIQTIVDELNGEGRSPSRGDNGARTQWVIDCVLEEYRAGSHLTS